MKNRCDTFIFTTLPDNSDTYSQSKLVWFLAHSAALLTDYYTSNRAFIMPEFKRSER